MKSKFQIDQDARAYTDLIFLVVINRTTRILDHTIWVGVALYLG